MSITAGELLLTCQGGISSSSGGRFHAADNVDMAACGALYRGRWSTEHFGRIL